MAKTGHDLTNPEFVRNINRLIDLVGGDELDKVQNFPWNSPQ